MLVDALVRLVEDITRNGQHYKHIKHFQIELSSRRRRTISRYNLAIRDFPRRESPFTVFCV